MPARPVSRKLVLYSRQGCHLCEVMHRQARDLLDGSGITLEIIDIDTDPALRERYDWRVPVLADGSEILCEGRLDTASLLDFLDDLS